MIYLFIFIIGATTISFSNVIVDRSHNNKNWFYTRSTCKNCCKTLKWYMIIPILYAITNNHRCFYCRKKFSILHTFTELIGGFIFIILYYNYNFYISCWLYSLFLIMYICSIGDFLYLELYTFPFTIMSFIWIILGINFFSLQIYIYNFFIFILLSILINKIINQYLGFGDLIYLSFYILFIPIEKLPFIIFISTSMAIIYWFTMKKINYNIKEIPFIPFISSSILLIFI